MPSDQKAHVLSCFSVNPQLNQYSTQHSLSIFYIYLMLYKEVILLMTLENTIFCLYSVSLVNLKFLHSVPQNVVLDSHYQLSC